MENDKNDENVNISTIEIPKEYDSRLIIEPVSNIITSNSKTKKKISLSELKSKAKQMDIEFNNIVSLETNRNSVDYNNMLSNNKLFY